MALVLVSSSSGECVVKDTQPQNKINEHEENTVQAGSDIMPSSPGLENEPGRYPEHGELIEEIISNTQGMTENDVERKTHLIEETATSYNPERQVTQPEQSGQTANSILSKDYEILSTAHVSEVPDYDTLNTIIDRTAENLSDYLEPTPSYNVLKKQQEPEYEKMKTSKNEEPIHTASSDYLDIIRPFDLNNPVDNPGRFHPDFKKSKKLCGTQCYIFMVLFLLFLIAVAATLPQMLARSKVQVTNAKNKTHNSTKRNQNPGRCLERMVPKEQFDLRKSSGEFKSIFGILPLPDGTCLIDHGPFMERNITRMDNKGTILNTVAIIDGEFNALVLSTPHILVLWKTEIVKIQMDGTEVERYTVPKATYLEYGIETKEGLLLVNVDPMNLNGYIMSYSIEANESTFHTEELESPKSVTRGETEEGILYAVCEMHKGRVNLYDANWKLLRHVGSSGFDAGQLMLPKTALFLPSGNILIAENGNGRISEFSLSGQFIEMLIPLVQYPEDIYLVSKYLWVLINFSQVSNIKMYQICQ